MCLLQTLDGLLHENIPIKSLLLETLDGLLHENIPIKSLLLPEKNQTWVIFVIRIPRYHGNHKSTDKHF